MNIFEIVDEFTSIGLVCALIINEKHSRAAGEEAGLVFAHDICCLLLFVSQLVGRPILLLAMQSTANYLWKTDDVLGQGATASVFKARNKVRRCVLIHVDINQLLFLFSCFAVTKELQDVK